MALGAVLAAALTDHSARVKGLYIDGIDVLKQPGNPGNLYGVLIESIEVVEQGPGQVSSMRFVIDDPLGTLQVGPGQSVRYQDITRDVPLFSGFLATYQSMPNGVGRTITVQCIGLEVVLDWMVVPSLSIAAGTDAYAAFQSTLAQALGIGVSLLARGSGVPSIVTQPLALGVGVLTASAVSVTNVTLRQALQSVSDAILASWTNPAIAGIAVTVDFYAGLRAWYVEDDGMRANWQTNDGDQITLVVSIAAGRIPANLQHEVSAGDVPQQAYITGASAAGSGLRSSGAGRVGPIAMVSDPNSTTPASVSAIAAAYFAAHGVSDVRGSVTCEENVNVGAFGAETHAGDTVQITDAQVGLVAFAAPMTSITKRFLASGAEIWIITYGAARASAATYLRRLTRATLS